MLGVAAMRFIRTQWRSTQNLAEELFALFSRPLKIQPSQIIIEQGEDATEPAILIRRPEGSEAPTISIQTGDITTPFTSGTSDNGETGTGIDLGDITFPDQDDDDVAVAVPDPTDNPFTLFGQVVEKVSGRNYKVSVWAKNPDTAPRLGTLTVTMAGLDVDEELPADTSCLVLCFPETVNGERTIGKAISVIPIFLPT